MPEDYRYPRKTGSKRQRGTIASKRQQVLGEKVSYEQAVANLKAAEGKIRGNSANAESIARPLERAQAGPAAKQRKQVKG